MSLQFILGNSGSGKSSFLYQKVIEESMAHPMENYLILVPEQFTMQTQKELVSLHPKHAIMNIDVLSFNRLAFRVFDELGKTDFVVLEETGKNLVLRKVAEEKKKDLPVLGGNLKKMGYISELKSLLSEFMQYNVTPDMLEELTGGENSAQSFSYKMRDVLTMYRGFLDYVEGTYITAEEILDLLADLAEDSALLRGSTLVFDGFTGFTPNQNKLLKVLFPLVGDVLVTVSMDEREDFFGKPQIQDLFYMSKKMIAGLIGIAEETGVTVKEPVILHGGDKKRFLHAPALYHLEQNLFRRKQRTYGEKQDAIRVLVLHDPKEELRFAAGEIRRLVREEHFRYRDFAIVSGDDTTYRNYAPQIFEEYDIPVFMDNRKNILFHPFPEFIRAVLEVIEQDFSYESVFRYYRTALTGLPAEKIDLLENYVLATGVRGHSGWEKKWVRLPKNWEEAVLEEVNAIREKFCVDIEPLYQVFRDNNENLRQKTVALYEFICAHEIAQKMTAYQKNFEAEGDAATAKEYEQIYGIVMDLLEKMVDLLGEECLSVREYREILDAGFEAANVGVIPPGYDRVVIGDIERTRLEHIRVLFFVGVNDGVIPKADSHGGIISELERERLSAEHIELAPTARERAFIQKFYLYLNMTKPSEKLYITYAGVNMDGKALRRSYLVGTVIKLFPGLSVEEAGENTDLWLVTPKSSLKIFLDGLSRVRMGKMDEEWKALYAWYAAHTKWADKAEELLDAAFYCHASERLSKEAAGALYGAVLTNSVTRLERFASCAFSHFLRYGLGLEERQISEFAPLDLGNVLHQALETYSKALEHSSYDWFDVPEAEMERLAETALADAVAAMRNSSLYDTAKDAYMVERMHNLLNRTVKTITEQIRRGSFLPENYEVSFSFTEDLDAVNFALGKEERMRLQGRIDRMDVWKNEDDIYVKIVDYKSGGSTQFELLSIYHGLQLQLVVYLNAGLELMQKRYPGKQILPGGIFYYHMDDPFIDVAEEKSDDMIFEEILGQLKMDGLVNAKTEVIDAMDRDLTGTSVILPVGRKKDGSLKAGSHAVEQEEFRELSAFVNRKIGELGKDMLNGNIDAAPYRLDKKEACAFCPYHGVCGFDEKMPGFSYRNLKKFDSDAEIFAQMRKEEYDGRDVDREPETGH